MENGSPRLTLVVEETVPMIPEPVQEAGLAQQAGNDINSLLKAEKPDDSSLTPEEKAMIIDFAQKIDLNDSTQILQYGINAQSKVSQFSESALAHIRTKDMGEVGSMITNLTVELNGFSPDESEKKGLMGLFKKVGNQAAQMKARYATAEKNVDRICDVLENHKMTMLKDLAMLDEMYKLNLAYFKELTMYILAGREKLADVIQTDLPALQATAKQSNNSEDAQSANYLADMCNRFDKKLHDLDLTRTICMQMSPQIRLVQSNDSMMVEKIQSTLVNTIPLWKNQMVVALSLVHSKNAIEAQREVTDTTNALLRKNADMLKTSTIEAAVESERSIVDIETLVHTNESLISTLDEVMQIHQDGREKRREAEVQLAQIEEDLKAKLLEIQGVARN